MNLQKWMNIYNSIIRLKFFAYLESENPVLIKKFDNHYQRFVDETNLNPKNEKVRFFGGDMLIGLSYLILVRTNEYINKDLDSQERKSVLKIENWKIFGITSFDKLISRYNINVTKLTEKTNKGKYFYTNDHEKLGYFIRKLRNAIGHYNYDNPNKSSIKLTDIDPKSGRIEMICIFNYAEFLNFCMDFGIMVNESLRQAFNHNKEQ